MFELRNEVEIKATADGRSPQATRRERQKTNLS
jgi:hypothetical protein